MKTFKLFNQTIEITDELDAYNSLFAGFSNRANEAKEKFVNLYHENIKSLDALSEKAFDMGKLIINEEISKVVNDITEDGYSEMTEDLFFEEYFCDLFTWENSFNEINDLYLDITCSEEEKDANRVFKRENRTKIAHTKETTSNDSKLKVAGTGAINVATDALNAASGIAYMGLNAVAKASSTVKASSKKLAIFKDKNTLNSLSTSIYNNVFSLLLSLAKFKTDKLDASIGNVSNEDSIEALAIFKNVVDSKLIDDEAVDLLVEAINLDPYNKPFYEYLIDNFGDQNLEVHEIASYFGYDLTEYKENIANTYCDQFVISTEDTALYCKEQVLAKMDYLGIKTPIPSLDRVHKALIEFDIIARTVNDILFDTREEATLANDENDAIKKALENFDNLSERTLIKLKAEFQSDAYKTVIRDSYLEKIEDRLLLLDIAAKTVNDILFDTREEAALANEEKVLLQKYLENFDDLDEAALRLIYDEILTVGFETPVKDRYFTKINAKLTRFDIEARTAYGDIFETREEAAEFKEYMDVRTAKITETLNHLIPVFLDPKYKTVIKNFYYFGQNGSVETKFKHAARSYAKVEKHEQPLFVFDNSLLKNADKGFLITDKGIHASVVKEMLNAISEIFTPKKVPVPVNGVEVKTSKENFVLIDEIDDISAEPLILSVNNLKCHNSNKKDLDVFEDLIKTIVDRLKKI